MRRKNTVELERPHMTIRHIYLRLQTHTHTHTEFSTATMVAGMHLNVTLNVHCLSC